MIGSQLVNIPEGVTATHKVSFYGVCYYFDSANGYIWGTTSMADWALLRLSMFITPCVGLPNQFSLIGNAQSFLLKSWRFIKMSNYFIPVEDTHRKEYEFTIFRYKVFVTCNNSYWARVEEDGNQRRRFLFSIMRR